MTSKDQIPGFSRTHKTRFQGHSGYTHRFTNTAT